MGGDGDAGANARLAEMSSPFASFAPLMKLRRVWIALVPVGALFLAGCGGGGGDDSTESTASTVSTPKALSKAELIEQGDAICAEVNAAVGSIESSETETTSPAQAANLYSGMVASLNNLGTPEESEGYAEFSSAAEELAKAEDEVKLASEREDSTALATAESNAAVALESFQEAAEEYGLEDCSEGPSAPVAGAEGTPGEEEPGGVEEGGLEAAPETEVTPEEAEPAPEPAPETGGGAGVEGGGTGGGTEGGAGETGGSSGGIGPG